MGIKNVVRRVAARAGDRVAQLSSLSPAQVENVQALREKYLLETPDPDDLTARRQTERLMAASSVEIFNAYLPQIKALYLPMQSDAEYGRAFDDGHNIRYINITKWVTDETENSLEKLVNVYAVLSNEDCNIALVFDRKQETTEVYLAVVNNKNASSSTDVENFKEQLIAAIRGNFPGAAWEEKGLGILPCFREEKAYSVATTSNIPTEKSEKFISQTIEKLIDGIIPKTRMQEYTIVLLATPVLDVEERKLKLGEFYSGMAPYASWSTNFQRTENESIGAAATVGVNVGASAGIQSGANSSLTDAEATTDSRSRSDSRSMSDSQTQGQADTSNESVSDAHGSNESTTDTEGISDSVGAQANIGVGAGNGSKVGIGVNYNHGWNQSTAKTLGKTAMQTISNGRARSLSQSVGKTVGTAVANSLGRAVTSSMAATRGISKAVSFGGNVGANFARSSTTTAMLGKNEGITQNYSNFNVQYALERLKEQMKRFEQSAALGMWDFAAYVMSEDANVAKSVAHSYLALTLGEESHMSRATIHTWRGNVEEEAGQAREISKYVRTLRHPVFGLNPGVIGKVEGGEVQVAVDETDEDSFIVYPPIVTATTSLSGKELAYSLNFPKRSITGLPVMKCVEFGRNIVSYDGRQVGDRELAFGRIFHMNREEETEVRLSKKSLASHTFITGSTGAGKSNAIYHLLGELGKEDVNFLVVEPAKGEYKNIFGSRDDVAVYGTNPLLSPLLKINPFRFPKNIHILEHMDRLVEIFNVCWPMYAAMPAVLKSAVEQSYLDCGWDLIRSVHRQEEEFYPTFADVARNVKEIIEKSEYDSDNKGAYKGSLLTRLQSLCNGINGMVFAYDEIDGADLFDANVIVDLSRVGSGETKALIMGMLVLKLQEYRISSAEEMNSELKHVTILEEAHNLLRNASGALPGAEGDLLGKSVEMLSNAIAEMRTYGEGFIIADQAPGLMDMSVIRNTNTKIILRLPDQSDRELVGKSANLNEDQIRELAKLPCGVAAVYQNEWVQPVLCKVDYFPNIQEPYIYAPDPGIFDGVDQTALEKAILAAIMDFDAWHKGEKSQFWAIESRVGKSKLAVRLKLEFRKLLKSDGEEAARARRCFVYDFLSAADALEKAKECSDIYELIRVAEEQLKPSVREYSEQQKSILMAEILREQSERDVSYEDTFVRYMEVCRDKGGVW